jgi:hypothetical protein
MEGLKVRSFILAGLLAGFGGYLVMTPQSTQAADRSEEWMLKTAPLTVGSFTTTPGIDSAMYSYKMDESTYKALQPYGIVARVMSDGAKVYDVVLVASNRKSSFHDPRVCFTAQGWTLKSFDTEKVDVPGRGSIPITFTEMVSPQGQTKVAAFCYQSDGIFFETSQRMTFHFLVEQLKGQTGMEGVFYRFIPNYEGATKEGLQDFIVKYLSEANTFSNGFF